jgi:hypothetical protein
MLSAQCQQAAKVPRHPLVMPGFTPGIHAVPLETRKTWMAEMDPAMTSPATTK